MGNIFARRPGRNNSLAPVGTGSHLDSQPTGGRFDGVYGVLAGLEVIRALNDAGIETERPVEASVWTNEEGSRFAPAMVASGVYAGVFTLEYGLSRVDVDGKSARLTPAPVRMTVTQTEIQALLKYKGPVVAVDAMRVTDYKG